MPLLPLWAFVACSRVDFTIYIQVNTWIHLLVYFRKVKYLSKLGALLKKTNVRINIILRRVRVTIVAVENNKY
jgi:hypothetical protein